MNALQQRVLRQEPLGPERPERAGMRAVMTTHQHGTVRSESTAAWVDDRVVAGLRDNVCRSIGSAV